MKKVLYFLFLALIITSTNFAQVTTLWEKSAATSSKPVWEAGSLTRGLSYGFVGGQHLLFVVNRSVSLGGKAVIYYNAVNGDSLGTLDLTGVSGGVAIINDIEVSSDGKIFLGNMTTNASADPFKVYRYDSLQAVPVVALSYNTTAERVGDKFTVNGSTTDNSAIIWVSTSLVSAGAGNLLKFTTTDNAISFTSTIVPLASVASSSSVGPLTDGSFFLNSHGATPVKYTSGGTAGTNIPSTVISTSGSAVRYLNTLVGNDYIVANELLNPSTNNAKIIKVPSDPTLATVFSATPVLGTTSAGGLGDVSVQKVSDYLYNIFVLATNNGFGAYQVDLTPALAGDYYIGAPGSGPAGSDPHFATLREAFDVLNDATFTANCTFYITSNTTETYTAPNYGLGLAIDPSPFTVTFKPYTGVQPVITLLYPIDGTSGPSGALVIGLPSKGNVAWNDMRATKNIIIDGSNTVGGTTRDLTIECATTAQRNAFPLTIVGDVSELVVMNSNIYYKAQGVSTSGNLFVSAVQLRSRTNLGADWIPHNILFENNHISSNFDGVVQSAQGYGTYASSPMPLDFPFNITLQGNLIEGKRRAIALYKAGSHDIIDNEIVLNQDIAANTTNEAIYAVDVNANSVVNINNNNISEISSKTNAASSGNTGISIESLGTYTVHNNFIHGFELTAENPVAFLTGIKNSSSTATLNCYFNTIYMDDVMTIGTGTVAYNGILISDGTNDVRNNIVFSAETDFVSYAINRTGALGTLQSDYNNFYAANATNGLVGFWNDAAASTLALWKTASSLDNNSLNVNPGFTSSTDLHLSSNFSPVVGKGISISGIGFDIDGEIRDTPPEIGADEFPGITPVELTSFTATLQDNKIVLEWATASETNNSGFEIQRKIENSSWNVVGNVTGKGTTSETQNYNFVDSDLASGKLTYRLKQLDFDGTFSYSKEIEVNGFTPGNFELLQNYPNPFNPVTELSFVIPIDSKIKLAVFSITGELVEVLADELLSAGKHTYTFNAAGYASGTYIYRLTTENSVLTKKMILMK